MTPTAVLIALPKLALGTVAQDTGTGRTGSIVDTGLAENETIVYYLLDDRGEWKADAVNVRQVEL